MTELVRALVPKVLVGTCGWSYDEWVGPFYPNDTVDRVRFYAERFPAVEVNYTHYQLPSPQGVAGTAARLGANGLQAIWKAPQALSHRALPSGKEDEAAALARDWVAALEAAARKGAAAGTLLQFSEGTKPGVAERGVEVLRAAGLALPLFVEVRNPAYAEEALLGRLHDALASIPGAIVAVDHLGAVVTHAPPSSTAYFRFHARSPLWDEPNPGGVHGANKYDAEYDATGLAELAERVREAKAERAFAFFNNHAGGKAARNALQFTPLVDALPPPRKKAKSLEDFS